MSNKSVDCKLIFLVCDEGLQSAIQVEFTVDAKAFGRSGKAWTDELIRCAANQLSSDAFDKVKHSLASGIDQT